MPLQHGLFGFVARMRLWSAMELFSSQGWCHQNRCFPRQMQRVKAFAIFTYQRKWTQELEWFAFSCRMQWRWFPYKTQYINKTKKLSASFKSWNTTNIRSRIASVSRPERMRSLPSAFKPEASLKFCARICFKPPSFQRVQPLFPNTMFGRWEGKVR